MKQIDFLDAYKVGLINSIAMMVSFSNLESILKISLLIVSVIYTLYKIREVLEKRKRDKKNDEL